MCRQRSKLFSDGGARAVGRVLLILFALPLVILAAVAGGAMSGLRARPPRF